MVHVRHKYKHILKVLWHDNGNFTSSCFLDFTYRGRLVAYFTKLIYHKVLINNKTEQDTKQEFAYM